MKETALINELNTQRKKLRNQEDELLKQAQSVLYYDQFNERNILNHLKKYNQKFELVDEQQSDNQFIFTKEEIKNTCIKYRLRFLSSEFYPHEFPYEVVLKIKDLNRAQGKDLRHFFVLSEQEGFYKDHTSVNEKMIFTQTELGNYYLIHRWGEAYKASKSILKFPFRNFETMFATVITLTLLVSLSLPTRLITSDIHAEYWSMYRVACFFHVLIIHLGFFVLVLFGFNLSLSSQNWDTRVSRRK